MDKESGQNGRGAIVFSENGVAFSPRDIKRVRNGIDLRVDTRPMVNVTGSGFERKCLNAITSGQRDVVILGPVLIDYIFSRNREVSGMTRPDAIKFKIDEDVWGLEEIFEFKEGKRKGIGDAARKIAGFCETLAYFRKHTGFLPEVITRYLSEVLRTPAFVYVAENSDLLCTFVYSAGSALPTFSREGMPVRTLLVK